MQSRLQDAQDECVRRSRKLKIERSTTNSRRGNRGAAGCRDGQRGMMKTEIGMGQSAVISEQSAVAADPGSSGVRSEMLGSSELTIWRGGFVSQGADGELVIRYKCPEIDGGKAEWGKLKYLGSRWGRGTNRGALLSSLAGLVPLPSANPPLETVGYYRSSLRDFCGGQGSAPVLRSGSVHPPQWLCYGGRATEGGLHAAKKLRNIQNRLFGFERKCFIVNVISKREERKPTGYPRISGADGWTPLPEARGGKAPEGWRSPRPGGLRGGIEHNEHLWGLRRRVSEADRAVARRRRMPGPGGVSFWKILEVKW